MARINNNTDGDYKMTKNVYLSIVLPLFIVACNAEQLPAGATLQISPKSRSIQISEIRDDADRCVISQEFYQDYPILVFVADGQGTPLGDTKISVYVDYSANTFGGYPVMALYDDMNGNGVVDSDTELVSGSEDGVFVSRTAQYSGEKMLLLRVNLSCEFKGSVFAYSGTASATMDIDVSAKKTEIETAGSAL